VNAAIGRLKRLYFKVFDLGERDRGENGKRRTRRWGFGRGGPENAGL